MTRGHDAVVFLGPSIPKGRVPDVPFEIRPPVKQGDVLRALANGATRIGIIDGYFDQVPSVWHKEILLALEEGVLVYGGASMGALRAAELHSFGMIGVGRVFEMYRDGVLEDDDEVALLHASAEDGHRPISDAMVNLRDLVDRAVKADVLPRGLADEAIAKLKALPYPMRSVRKLVELAPPLVDFAKQPSTPLKELDARLLLERMTRNEDQPLTLEKRTRVERTVFLERLRHDVMLEGARPVAAREELLALLAVAHAISIGATPTSVEVNAVLREVMEQHRLATDEDLAAFIESRKLDVDRFLSQMREEATVRRLEGIYGPEIARRLEELAWRSALSSEEDGVSPVT